MAVYGLTTFEDILNAILEEVKIPSTDTVEVNRIKRDINMTYVGRVAPAKRWQWLSGFVSREFKPFYSDGTVAVTPDSTTITFSIAPATSKTGYLFATDNYSEIYVICIQQAQLQQRLARFTQERSQQQPPSRSGLTSWHSPQTAVKQSRCSIASIRSQ